MSEYIQIWLFAGAFGLSGGLCIAVAALRNQMAVLQATQDTLIKFLGQKAAFLLHSPHTLELDALIDKFRGQTITDAELQEFINMLLIIESDTAVPKGERLLATLVLLAIETIDKKGLKGFNVGDSITRHRTDNKP